MGFAQDIRSAASYEPRLMSLRAAFLAGAITLGVPATALAKVAEPPAAAAAAAATDPQESSAEPTGLQDIVVTARRKTERLQDVPVAVTAVSGADLDAYSLNKVQEMATRIPTLTIAVGGSGAGGAVQLRGVGSSTISAAFDSAVAIYVDDLAFSSARVLQSAYLDIGQLEVLKGPQSLFFGKSASAGVLSFVSRNPSDRFEAAMSTSYEFEEKGKVAEGSLSGPISDRLSARIALRYSQADEIMYNAQPGVTDRSIGDKSFDAKLTFVWKPTDTFRINLKGSYSHYQSDTATPFTEVRCATPPVAQPSVYSPLLGLINPALAPLAVNQSVYGCAYKDQKYFVPWQNPIEARRMVRGRPSGEPYTDLAIKYVRAKAEWDLTPHIRLTSVTGFSQIHSEEYGDFAFTSEGGGAGTPLNDVKTYSQELRLATSFDGPFNVQVGAYYENRKSLFQTGQTAFGATLALSQLYPLTGGAAGPFAAFGPTGADPLTGNTFDYEYSQLTRSKTLSGFANASLKLTDRLTLSGGVRFTDERKKARFDVLYMHGFLSAIGLGVPTGTQSAPLPFNDQNLSPEVSLTYKINRDVSLYGAFKTGFKSGGIDTSALPTQGTFASIAACAPAYKPGDCPVIFGSEKSKGGEIGLKSELFGRTLRLNLVGYYYVYNNLQVQQFIATQTLFRTFNVGEIATRGLEADFEYITPIEGLRLSGAVAYLHNRFTKDFISAAGFNFRGLAPDNSPTLSGNIRADYKTDLSSSLTFALGGSASFQSSYYANSQEADRFKYEGFGLVDLRASIGGHDDRWTLSLIGNNIFDKIVVNRDGPRPFALPGPADQLTMQNRGRQVYVRAGIKF